MARRFLSYGRQLVTDDDITAVADVLRGDFLTQGPAVPSFEAAVAERVGVRHAVAVANGTAALHLACLAAGVTAADVAVTTPMTFAATANAVRYCDGEVVFGDIDADHLAMTPEALRAALVANDSAKVVLPVDFAGLAAESAAIRKVAGDRVVIEDAAQALGGSYEDGAAVGSCAWADMTIFSLHPVKSITSGEGGIITTTDDDLAHRLRLLRSHGIEREVDALVDAQGFEDGDVLPWYHEQQLLGFNYRMTDIQAALGLSQLGRLDEYMRRRREIAARYDDAFAALDAVELPQRTERHRSANHLYVARVDFERLGTTRRQMFQRLRCHDVGAQVHFLPVYRHPYYRQRYGLDPTGFPVTERHYAGCLSLPLHPGLIDDEVERVVAAFTEAVTR